MSGRIFASIIAVAACCCSCCAQVMTTFAGNGSVGYSGNGGLATAAQLHDPTGVCADARGNIYVADQSNYVIRKVTPLGVISTFAGNGGGGYFGDGGPATGAMFNLPSGVCADLAGNIYVVDYFNGVVRKIDTSGMISTVAGQGGGGYTGDGGPASAALLFYPVSACADGAGNLLIADRGNSVIRMVDTAGIITTFAGNASLGYNGDGGPATAAALDWPSGICADGAGNIYIADYGNSCVRMVNPAGFISTVAGNGSFGFSGDGGPATAAQLNYAYGVCIDAAGNLFISDPGNSRVRMVDAAGIITTVAGNGHPAYNGDGLPAIGCALNNPESICIDPAGNLYIADEGNDRVRVINALAASGVRAVAASRAASVYPNPTSGIVYFYADQPLHALLTAMDGAIVADEPLATKLDMSRLADGWYLLGLYDRLGTLVHSEKLVKTSK